MNKAINNCIHFIHLEKIGVRDFNKNEKNIWRCLSLIIQELLNSNWIVFEKEIYTTINTLDETPKIKKREYPVNMLNIKQILPLNILIKSLSRGWPRIIPTNIRHNLDEIHENFNYGKSKLVYANENLINVLQKVHEIGFKYDTILKYRICFTF